MVQTVMSDQRKVLTIGGDHSIALGSVDGHVQAKNGEVCLLWVDAHADLNTANTSDSGHMHGMPVSLLVKELADYWPYLPGLDWQTPRTRRADSARRCAHHGNSSQDRLARCHGYGRNQSAYWQFPASEDHPRSCHPCDKGSIRILAFGSCAPTS
ncbi:unnamed protein product [Nesidiocoris tenuis]|uniref:Arginase n=1 Tax=Nesidiocoris tenuis TaxID=355587 RepID=A0A6H5GZS1_9HEMI|nr:unnamed protein product [Nesidiocoris tenuis]